MCNARFTSGFAAVSFALVLIGTLCGQGTKPATDPNLPASNADPTTLPAGSPHSGSEPASELAKGMEQVLHDKQFLQTAAMESMTQLELGKLASEKATSEVVKQFARTMVEDHARASSRIKRIAGKESFAIPETLDAKHQARVDKLAKLTGEEFDRAYIKDQVKTHERDVRWFDRESQQGNNDVVRNFAARSLPGMQEHLRKVKDLEKTEVARGKSQVRS